MKEDIEFSSKVWIGDPFSPEWKRLLDVRYWEVIPGKWSFESDGFKVKGSLDEECLSWRPEGEGFNCYSGYIAVMSREIFEKWHQKRTEHPGKSYIELECLYDDMQEVGLLFSVSRGHYYLSPKSKIDEGNICCVSIRRCSDIEYKYIERYEPFHPIIRLNSVIQMLQCKDYYTGKIAEIVDHLENAVKNM